MKEKNIYKELFNLVKKTGEKLVVINPENDEAVVVLRLSDYEKLRKDDSEEPRYIENKDTNNENMKNFSFWNHSKNSDQKLDMSLNSGRIDSLDIQGSGEKGISQEESAESVDDIPDDDDAGAGYVFEPIEPFESEEHNL